MEDRIEVTFDGTSSVLELDRFVEGTTIETVIVMDTVSDGVQGWCYGIAHDASALTPKWFSIQDTALDGFVVEDWATVHNIQTCLTERCSPDEPGDRKDGGGWISAIVLNFMGIATLSVGRNSIARAGYTLDRNVGPAGTLLEVSDQLVWKGSQLPCLQVTIDGRSRLWRTAVDGWIGVLGDEPQELRRTYCDPADPLNGCPGLTCLCADSSLEITFEGDSDSIFEYETFEAGMEIEAVLVLDIQSGKAQGWSYGIAHDEDSLKLGFYTSEGTGVEAFLGAAHYVMINASDVQTCLTESCSKDKADGERRDGGGLVGAIVLDFMDQSELPVGRHTFARARYALKRDVGTVGTALELTDSLARRDSSRVTSSITVDDWVRFWSTVVDGWIRRAPWDGVPFRRGDVGVSLPGDDHPADGFINVGDAVRILFLLFWNEDGYVLDCEKAADVDDDGGVTIDDPVMLLRFLFTGGERPPEPFEAEGMDGTHDALTCERYR